MLRMADCVAALAENGGVQSQYVASRGAARPWMTRGGRDGVAQPSVARTAPRPRRKSALDLCQTRSSRSLYPEPAIAQNRQSARIKLDSPQIPADSCRLPGKLLKTRLVA